MVIILTTSGREWTQVIYTNDPPQPPSEYSLLTLYTVYPPQNGKRQQKGTIKEYL